MSILIKGMEMPREKKTTLTIFPDGRVYENHGERLWGQGEDCIPWKAVSVPPHGDLIDRDKLLKDDPEIHEDWIDSDGYCWDSEWGYTREQIENAPIIIPAEEGENKE